MTGVVQYSCRSFTKVHAVSELNIWDRQPARPGVRSEQVAESDFLVSQASPSSYRSGTG